MIEIVLADDRALIRAGLRRILAEFPDLHVVAETTTGIDLVETAGRTTAAVVLLSAHTDWPRITTIVHALRRAKLHVLVVTTDPSPDVLERLHAAGAAAVLTTAATPDELARALVGAGSGRSPRKRATRSDSTRSERPLPQLSNREYEVMRMLGSGRSVVAIAARLGLSPKTVGTYRARVMDKLGLANTAELVRFVLERGLAE